MRAGAIAASVRCASPSRARSRPGRRLSRPGGGPLGVARGEDPDLSDAGDGRDARGGRDGSVPAVLLERAGRPATDAAIVACRLADSCGVPVADVLRECAAGVAEAESAAAERRRALAGPAATARLLAWLPLVSLLLSTAIGVDAIAVAADGAAGTMSVAAGIALVAVGRWWSARLVRAAGRTGDPG